MLNTFTLSGQVTNEVKAVTQTLQNKQRTIVSLCLKINPDTEGKKPEFIDCQAFGNTARNIVGQVKQGDIIVVSGSLHRGLIKTPEGREIPIIRPVVEYYAVKAQVGDPNAVAQPRQPRPAVKPEPQPQQPVLQPQFTDLEQMHDTILMHSDYEEVNY